MLLAVITIVSLTTIPALGQMPGMSGGGKMHGKRTPTKASTQKMAMCCIGGMNMDKMMSGTSAAAKKKMGKCCMAGMKAGDMKMGDMMAGMSAADKKKMGKCCMSGMKAGAMKMGRDK